MEHLTREFRERPVWDLVVALARIERGRRALDAGARLGTADQRLVWLLVSEGPRTMREISQDLGLEQSTVNRQVNAALAAGLLERVERPGERAMTLRPTDAGLELFVADMGRLMEVLAEALRAVPADESDRFMEHLALFADAYRRAADEAPEL